MSYVTLVALTLILLIGLAGALDCYAGRVGFGMLYSNCGPGINYCIKRTITDPMYGVVTDKGCDAENFCSNVGSRCLYNSFGDTEVCCCTSNLCNGARTSFSFHLSISLLVAAFSFVVLHL